MTDPDKLREAIHRLRAFAPAEVADIALVCNAAESTLPKTKTMQVWRVEAALPDGPGGWLPISGSYLSLDEAKKAANRHTSSGLQCVSITGPHDQEVPA